MCIKKYSYEELKNHELFKDYEISEYNALINKNSKVEIFFEYKPSSNSSNPITKIINKFIAKENIFRLAVVEKNIALMEEVAKDILKSAPIVLNLLKTQGEWYQKYLNFIAEILLFVKPEFQPDIIKQLANIEDFAILGSFSEILLATKKYDEIITLLAPRPANLVNNEQKQESKFIYFCRYNLSVAYNNTGKLSLDEEQLLRILKDRPNDSASIYSLFNIYLLNERATATKNLIKNAPTDIKILTAMSFNLAEIAEAKLNLINQDNLSKDSQEQFRCFQYIAKYNQYSAAEKIMNEENLKDE
ncbi:hypothetical protein [Rickettsia honei]|uniref:hypothetical protein n=1 Tax=Rickettsia honei TaxID=37816 RepID=UPI0002E50DC0|nr:hypothetical protein [Rickettsia honei]